MEEPHDAVQAIDQLQKEIKRYAELRLALIKAEASEKIAQATGQLLTLICIGILLLVTIVFLGIAAGFYLTTLYGSATLGFGTVAVFYILLSIIAIAFRNILLIKPISNKVVSVLYEEEEYEKD